ncbi:putative nepenthesin [Helianthus annuus]|uniref:Nepenthesin n=1 Tax=Helianthus annuus TaxID=4232 RepID=A0A251TTN9_HELAN|nr:aspartyl protease family protein At5g10770 isoform X2 [Helianthus annuus]KAF5790130.1 putative nepenthesin [Helianthus annuus]KAJ0533492.1 putative nepenthesin [Helianthus annuus]KAJ0752802.1 putative nepenthesin [Helianthus annuus]KAJ0887464.1 putative nepenthesin [Helianthus annuus]
MASSYSLILLLSCCSLFFVFITATQEFAFNTSEGEEAHHYHTLQLTSLLPSSVCNPSALGNKRSRGSLEVVHKHGPCSTLNEDTVKSLTVEEILTNDQSRVDSIRARLATKTGKKDILGSKATIPAKSGSTIGSGNYIVTVGLGTPAKQLSLIFDTGSDLTWTQCEPCARSCYDQKEPIFAPSKSTTYSNISCTATQCSELTSATGNDPGCSASTCVYGIQYGDQSFSVGFFGKEKLTLTSKDVVNGFFFGCGQNNQGLFGGAAGLLGLGRDRLSIVSQTANKYRKVFSYCLPSRSSSTGYLTFGSSGVGRKVKYTRLSGSSRSFYGLTLTAITVGGTKLPISPTVFQTSGIIIDSGTVITRLPPTAYSALSKAFKAQMKKYPLTRSLSILDTCYDLTNYQTVEIPKISVLWGGNTLVEIAPQGILYANGVSQVCLAFAPNGDDSDIGIFGNVQQKSLAVVYDVAGGRVGFAQGGCA